MLTNLYKSYLMYRVHPIALQAWNTVRMATSSAREVVVYPTTISVMVRWSVLKGKMRRNVILVLRTNITAVVVSNLILTISSLYPHHILTISSPYPHHILTLSSPYPHLILTISSPYPHHNCIMTLSYHNHIVLENWPIHLVPTVLNSLFIYLIHSIQNLNPLISTLNLGYLH